MATLSYLTTTYFDFGALKRLPKTLAGLGIKRPLIATDRGLRQAGILAKVEAAIGGPAIVFDRTPENPTEAAVMDAVGLYRQTDATASSPSAAARRSISARRWR